MNCDQSCADFVPVFTVGSCIANINKACDNAQWARRPVGTNLNISVNNGIIPTKLLQHAELAMPMVL
jgi:hypothetical protein